MIDGDEDHTALRPGALIAEFRIERVLGSGGFGITYLAHHTALGREVAVNEYLPAERAARVGGADGRRPRPLLRCAHPLTMLAAQMLVDVIRDRLRSDE